MESGPGYTSGLFLVIPWVYVVPAADLGNECSGHVSRCLQSQAYPSMPLAGAAPPHLLTHSPRLGFLEHVSREALCHSSCPVQAPVGQPTGLTARRAEGLSSPPPRPVCSGRGFKRLGSCRALVLVWVQQLPDKVIHLLPIQALEHGQGGVHVWPTVAAPHLGLQRRGGQTAQNAPEC